MKSLLPILQQAFPAALSYEPLASPIIQANAEGQLVSVSFDIEDGDTDAASCHTAATKTCFVKTVDANQYNEKKAWPDLRRTLMYLRTEVRFYQEILPDLLSAMGGHGSDAVSVNFSTPEVFAAHYDLDGLLTEEERATDDPTKEPANVDWSADTNTNANTKGGYIVMEAISDTEYTQESPITIQQAKEALESIAVFHASAWENETLLKKAQDRLSKGSYHLKTRNPKEVAGLPKAWTQFSAAFGIVNDDDDEENLGKRIQDLAEYICDETSPDPTDQYTTLSHGDFKAMNCFLPIQQQQNDTASTSRRGVILVDFASTGVGLGMSDVAMLIHHAVRPEHLENGGEIMLVDHYLDALNKKLLLSKQRHEYPKEVALWHYKLAVADYFRFFLGRFWKTATPESFEKKKDSKNTALINRDRDAAFRFLERAKTYVSEIEKRRRTETI